MKTLLPFCLILMLSGNSVAQNRIEVSYSFNDADSVIRVGTGDTIYITNCDTAYLVSYPLVKSIRESLGTSNDLSFLGIKELQQTIDDLNFAIDSYHYLHKRYGMLSENTQDLLNESNKQVAEIYENLTNVESLSREISKNVNSTAKLIKDEKQKQFWKGLGKFGSGVVIGVSIGVLIVSVSQ